MPTKNDSSPAMEIKIRNCERVETRVENDRTNIKIFLSPVPCRCQPTQLDIYSKFRCSFSFRPTRGRAWATFFFHRAQTDGFWGFALWAMWSPPIGHVDVVACVSKAASRGKTSAAIDIRALPPLGIILLQCFETRQEL